jgi:hypothetical protein
VADIDIRLSTTLYQQPSEARMIFSRFSLYFWSYLNIESIDFGVAQPIFGHLFPRRRALQGGRLSECPISPISPSNNAILNSVQYDRLRCLQGKNHVKMLLSCAAESEPRRRARNRIAQRNHRTLPRH